MNQNSLTYVTEFLRKKIIESNYYQNREKRFFVAAATVDRKGKILSWGENSYSKSHPLMKQYNKQQHSDKVHKIYLHAEISALIKTRKQAHGIVIVRINHSRNYCYSKPCPICSLAIKESDIKEVYYCGKNGAIEEAAL